MNYDFSFTGLTHYVSCIKTFLEIKTKQCFGACVYIYIYTLQERKGPQMNLFLPAFWRKYISRQINNFLLESMGLLRNLLVNQTYKYI